MLVANMKVKDKSKELSNVTVKYGFFELVRKLGFLKQPFLG